MADPRYRRVTSIEPVRDSGGSRRTRIRIPQPMKRPLKTEGVIRTTLLDEDPQWFALHKRGVRRPMVGMDPLEARAVSEASVRGYLNERIVYKWLTANHFSPMTDFDYQCISSSHKILTADLRWIELRDVVVGDKIFGFDDSTRTYCETEITHHELEVKDGLEVELSDGTTMFTTREHPWLVYKDLRAKDRLVKGSSVAWARSDELRPGIRIPKYIHLC